MATNPPPQTHELIGFPEHFMGVRKETFKELFIEDLVTIQRYLSKELFVTNTWFSEPSLSHKELSLWVAGNAMNCMASTSYRNWTQLSSSAEQLYWNRLIWRLVHLAPIGHIFSQNVLGRKPSRTWNPVTESHEEYFQGQRMTISPSNRPLSPTSIGLSLFLKLFPEYKEDVDCGMELFALFDFFDSAPNPDNPLVYALRKSLRVTVLDQHRPLPFFWESFIRLVFASSPQDLMQFETRQPGDNQVHSEDEIAEYMNFGRRRAPAQTAPEQPSNNPPDKNSSDTQVLDKIYTLVSSGIESGEFKVNCGGALVHKVAGKYYFVYPIVFKRLVSAFEQAYPETSLTESTLETLLVGQKILTPVNATLTKPDSETIPITLAEISGKAILNIIADPKSYQDNLIITIGSPL